MKRTELERRERDLRKAQKNKKPWRDVRKEAALAILSTSYPDYFATMRPKFLIRKTISVFWKF